MTFSSERGCSSHGSKDPSKRLFILLFILLSTFLTSQNVLLGLDFVNSLPRRPENSTGGGGGFPSAFHAAGLPTQPSVVLSGSCSQQYASRRGDAVLFADKEVVDFLEPQRDSYPCRSKVIPADLSSCLLHSLPVL